jgi:hypothetical protein
MRYPLVKSEMETIELAATMSLARYGDGELRTCLGGDAISQRHRSDKLVAELRNILQVPVDGLLVGIPNVMSKTPKADSWAKYGTPSYTKLYGPLSFGSSFITRPDSAPWIDVPEYWEKVRDLWRGKDITLAVGDKKSVTSELIAGEAASLREVWGPRTEAYDIIDQIEEQIGKPSGTVIMCLGVTATVLAARLARKGVHAIDLGHIGMFMRAAGAYRYVLGDLVSKGYRGQLTALHKSKRWGADGKKHADRVLDYYRQIEGKTLLDYGCGEETLAAALKPLGVRVSGYDPGMPGKEGMPKPCDLVVCTDVLEHIEPDKLLAVIDHIHALTLKNAYIQIATRPAKTDLPDGRNAHLIIRPTTWWEDVITTAGFTIDRKEDKEGHGVTLWLTK